MFGFKEKLTFITLKTFCVSHIAQTETAVIVQQKLQKIWHMDPPC